MKEESRQRYAEDMQTKRRLSRMMSDYAVTRQKVAGRREEDYQAAKADALAKMEQEMVKRRERVLKERAEEAARLDAEERARREQEREEERLEQGKFWKITSSLLIS